MITKIINGLRRLTQPSPYKLTPHYLVKKYGTNPEYTREYLTHLLSEHSDNPLFYLYLESELGALKRNTLLMQQLCDFFHDKDLFKDKDCIDIGCSSASSLIALTRGGASKAVGIEVLEARFQTALRNISECPKEVREKVDIHLNSVLDTPFMNQLGNFDIIFCTDVLEHVKEPELAIKNICSLLSRERKSFAFVQVGNYKHPAMVLNEPHYGFPGMTLLPYEAALRYFNNCRLKQNQSYGVYYWKTFSEYKKIIESFGFACKLMTVSGYNKKQLLSTAAKIPDAVLNQFKDRRLDIHLRDEILQHVKEYLSEINREHTSDEFVQKFGVMYYEMVISHPVTATKSQHPS